MTMTRIRLNQIKSNTVNYDNFEEQVIGMSIPFFEEFTAKDSQTDFVLSTNFKVGSNTLKVFLNGMLQDLSIDGSYIEVDESTIRFNEPLYKGDWVVFRIEGAGSGTTLEDHIHHVREIPIGPVDGVNRNFILSYAPRLGTEHVYKNGLLMFDGVSEDYTINDEVITFVEAPLANSKILVTYIE